MKVLTILEAQVEEGKAAVLQEAFRKGLSNLPPQMDQTFLIQGVGERTLWRILSVWKSREALDEMRKSVAIPDGILMFRAAGAEPKLSVFDVPEYAP